jgi:hypothetical protein
VSRRAAYALMAAALIAVGLTTRLPMIGWPPSLAKYAGSIIWGAMLYMTLAFLLPRLRAPVLLALALAIGAAVEFSQLWHRPWLDDFRRTTVGVLLIGRFFSWWDIVCYGIGMAGAWLYDVALVRKRLAP